MEKTQSLLVHINSQSEFIMAPAEDAYFLCGIGGQIGAQKEELWEDKGRCCAQISSLLFSKRWQYQK